MTRHHRGSGGGQAQRGRGRGRGKTQYQRQVLSDEIRHHHHHHHAMCSLARNCFSVINMIITSDAKVQKLNQSLE